MITNRREPGLSLMITITFPKFRNFGKIALQKHFKFDDITLDGINKIKPDPNRKYEQ